MAKKYGKDEKQATSAARLSYNEDMAKVSARLLCEAVLI